jgi:hypothetical protein
VHHVAQREVAGVDDEPGLFAGLAAHGRAGGLAAIDVAGHDAVVAVLVAGVVPPQQQDATAVDQQQVRLRDQGEPGHRGPARHARGAAASILRCRNQQNQPR